LIVEVQIDPNNYKFQINSLVHPVRRIERNLENLRKYNPNNPLLYIIDFKERFNPIIHLKLKVLK
ncbi:uncharacterized protein B0T23DRAFT_328182, partial [Neurospora hispaniola]